MSRHVEMIAYVGGALIATSLLFLRRRRRVRGIPVVLITDIGRDIDDTLALIALSGMEREGSVRLVGVIATGGVGKLRARVARGWIRKLGYSEKIPVAACLELGKDECVCPPFTPKEEDANIYDGSAAELLSLLLTKYPKMLRIAVIAPMSPIASLATSKAGLRLLRANCAALWIQGQFCFATSGNGLKHLEPDGSVSYNMRVDLNAARLCFRVLQDYVPFRFVGKHAVYQLPLTRRHVTKWDEMLGTSEMTDLARDNLSPFREREPALFERLYPFHDGDDETSTSTNWFDRLKFVSKPYDAVCVYALYTHAVGAKARLPFESVASGARPGKHLSIGNSAESPRIRDAPAVVYDICRLIEAGLPVP